MARVGTSLQTPHPTPHPPKKPCLDSTHLQVCTHPHHSHGPHLAMRAKAPWESHSSGGNGTVAGGQGFPTHPPGSPLGQPHGLPGQQAVRLARMEEEEEEEREEEAERER